MDPVASKRGKQTVRDMILSTLVIAACAGVIYIFIPKDEHADPMKAVDFTVELATVRTAAPYPVAAPEGLPKEWKATSVRYDGVEGNAWHLGFLDADRRYVAVEQSTTAAGTYVPEVSRKAKDTGRTETVVEPGVAVLGGCEVQRPRPAREGPHHGGDRLGAEGEPGRDGRRPEDGAARCTGFLTRGPLSAPAYAKGPRNTRCSGAPSRTGGRARPSGLRRS